MLVMQCLQLTNPLTPSLQTLSLQPLSLQRLPRKNLRQPKSPRLP
jgi:hypothetical protein